MRVTEPAQRAVTQAKQEAGRLGHDRVGTEHLLLGLLRDEGCLAVASLGELRIAPETVRRRVAETVGHGQGEQVMGFYLPTTKPFTLVLGLAGSEAMRLEGDRLGTEHLLLGLASEGEGVAALGSSRSSAPASWSCGRRWRPSMRLGSILSRSRPTGDRRPGSHQRGRGWVGWSH
jgi:ATP-dependent Clp protease ATP-binding subunit ClpA